MGRPLEGVRLAGQRKQSLINDETMDFSSTWSSEKISSVVGTPLHDVCGVEIDFQNRRQRRLAGAIGKTWGADFNGILPWQRRRCAVADDGEILACWGEPGFTDTGALTVAAAGKPAGTIAQTMVYQPKFYYRVEPVVLDGQHLRKARYFISASPRPGFKLHPAFMRNGARKDYVLIGAFEACLQQGTAYNLTDAQTGDFTPGTGDRLASRAGAKPVSGLTQQFTRANARTAAQNRGPGWTQLYAAIHCATLMLMLVEFGGFNTQNAIGRGVVDLPSGTGNESLNTGTTASFGNSSGTAPGIDEQAPVSYRGQENPWGNIWEFVDGINMPASGSREIFIADHDFEEGVTTGRYVNAGIQGAASNGFVSAFAHSEPFDWLFVPSETVGDSELPVGDWFWQNWGAAGFRVAYAGGHWTNASLAGGFAVALSSAAANRSRHFGGRAVFVP